MASIEHCSSSNSVLRCDATVRNCRLNGQVSIPPTLETICSVIVTCHPDSGLLNVWKGYVWLHSGRGLVVLGGRALLRVFSAEPVAENCADRGERHLAGRGAHSGRYLSPG